MSKLYGPAAAAVGVPPTHSAGPLVLDPVLVPEPDEPAADPLVPLPFDTP